MKAMTAEQKQIINDLLVNVGDLLSEEKMTHILNAIKPEASSNYPHGQIIIKDLNILLTNKNLNKENNMQAMTEAQKALITKLMTDYHHLFTPREHTALCEVFEAHDNKTKIASFEAAKGTIQYLNEKISTHKEVQSEKETIIIEDGFDHQTNNKKEATNMATNANTCPKCSGTGVYNVPLKDGSIGKCFTCKGTGTKQSQSRAMTEPQIKLIRDLFAEAKQFMTQKQIDNLVNAMLAHKSGAHTKSVQWASAAIDKLKEIKATKKS